MARRDPDQTCIPEILSSFLLCGVEAALSLVCRIRTLAIRIAHHDCIPGFERLLSVTSRHIFVELMYRTGLFRDHAGESRVARRKGLRPGRRMGDK